MQNCTESLDWSGAVTRDSGRPVAIPVCRCTRPVRALRGSSRTRVQAVPGRPQFRRSRRSCRARFDAPCRLAANEPIGPKEGWEAPSLVTQADLTLRINPAMVRSRWIGIHGDRVGGWNGAGTRSPVAGIEGRFAVAERIRARNAFAVRACESSGPARGCCCFAMLSAAFGAWSPGLAGAPHHACIQSGRSRPALGGIRR